MAAIQELSELTDSLRHDETSNNSKWPSTFLNAVALGNVVSLHNQFLFNFAVFDLNFDFDFDLDFVGFW